MSYSRWWKVTTMRFFYATLERRTIFEGDKQGRKNVDDVAKNPLTSNFIEKINKI